MRLVADDAVLEVLAARGGAVYLWPKAYRCCGGRQHVLEASTEAPARSFRPIGADRGIAVYATPGLAEPTELHLELGRSGDLRAFWNGQGWIG